ncbi:uncharacterized protein LOC109703694 [Ananas comosus]|uniref:Uncharacterized protein LOC109703694 n=1 Tax=Ananas comosus TaxID=4615 RepID=A0A6P5E9X0_ANACO|nr:uncharacterized protein LOC109703694 [Ananas comosus]
MAARRNPQGKPRNRGIKHQWTKEEDDKLIECLLGLTNSGHWRADNGNFRCGFLQQLEKLMSEKLPGCGLTARPHITSRIKLWKRQYNAIAEMLGAAVNGFGWDGKDKTITCERSVYDDWVVSHPSAAGLRGKSFPYVELSVVFGKDHATEAAVEPLANAVVATAQEELAARASGLQVEMEDVLGADESDGASAEQSSACSGTKPNTAACSNPRSQGRGSGTRRGTKRKSVDVDRTMISTLRSIVGSFAKFTESISKLASCFQYMADEASRGQRLFDELSKIDGLSREDLMDAVVILSSDTSKMNVFYLVPVELRKLYVSRILRARR